MSARRAVHWLLELDVFGPQEQRLAEAARRAGHRVSAWRDDWWESGAFPLRPGEPVVFRGSLANADRIARSSRLEPGAFCATAAFHCSHWFPSARPWLLAERWVLTTVAALTADPAAIAGELGGPERVFVRPDGPLKAFSGRVVAVAELTPAALDHGFYFDDLELPVIVCPVREVLSEWRCVVAAGRLIAASPYDATRQASSAPEDDDLRAFAARVAAELPPPEAIYILDVCRTPAGPRIVELNPFSGADLYDCPPDRSSPPSRSSSRSGSAVWRAPVADGCPTRRRSPRSKGHKGGSSMRSVLFLCLSCVFACAQSPEPGLERVAVAGASVSAGYRVRHPQTGERLSLADCLTRMIVSEHEMLDHASEIFGFDPNTTGRLAARRIKEAQPGLVIAVDFLFWFVYGRARDEAARLASLEDGLALLEGLDAPLLVGLLPQMEGGRMLQRDGVPEDSTLAAANERIRAWAEERGAVVVELDSFMARLRAGEEVTVGDATFTDTRELLQEDNLHVTLVGLCALAAASLEALADARPELEVALRLAPQAVADELEAVGAVD